MDLFLALALQKNEGWAVFIKSLRTEQQQRLYKTIFSAEDELVEDSCGPG